MEAAAPHAPFFSSRLAWPGKCRHRAISGRVLGQGIVQAPARLGLGAEKSPAPAGLGGLQGSCLCSLLPHLERDSQAWLGFTA